MNYDDLNATVANLLKLLNMAGANVDATLQPIFFIGGCLLLVFACAKFMWQRSLAPLAAFVVSWAMLMVIISLSQNWMPLTENYMTAMGTYGARIGGFTTAHLTPSSVIMRGLEMADKMYTENVSWLRLVFGTTEDSAANLLMLIVIIGTILISCLMAVFVMVFFIIMKLASIVALVFLVFMLFDWSRFMAAPGVARILGYGVQMLVMSLIAGMMFTTIDNFELANDRLQISEAISLLAVVMFFAGLFFSTTNLAREQISGMPVLSLNEPANLAGRAAMGALGMMPGVGKLALGSMGGMSMPRMTGGGSSIGGGGSAGGTSGVMSAGQRQIGAAPASAMRMLNNSKTIDGTWTEARDLGPKAAQRMLTKSQQSLPAPPRALPPPRS